MNVGVIPYFIPTLFATNLNRIALSAIRPESVYARAVSKTPGPVSVSGISVARERERAKKERRGKIFAIASDRSKLERMRARRRGRGRYQKGRR